MDAILKAIESGDVGSAVHILFDVGANRTPHLRVGFRRESDLWDFKAGLPRAGNDKTFAWAEIAADVAAFHNHKGGLLFFGVRDHDFSYVGTRDRLDAKMFNDQLRRYLGDKFWVEFAREFIGQDQSYLGVALVPPRRLIPVRMHAGAPARPNGARTFKEGDLCIRDGDQTRILSGAEASEFLANARLPSGSSTYMVDEPEARILRPDWDNFVFREQECSAIRQGLADDRTYVTTVTGVGGVGKTALACWATLQAYNEGRFEYFVSISAKDRVLTPAGIMPVQPGLSSFEDLLNQTLEVLGFSEVCLDALELREQKVRTLLIDTKALLFVDNLETVDDQRVVRFLETLPKPVKALTTSRLAGVRTAAFPLTVGPLTENEAIQFLEDHARRLGRHSLLEARVPEKERIVSACDRVPLVLEWLIGRSQTLADALSLAEALTSSRKKDFELLEFCFRRVHSTLTDAARSVLGALALQEKPLVLEALSAATDLALDVVDEAANELEDTALLDRVWDPKMNDTAFCVLPLTRRFAYRELQNNSGREKKMRSRLTDWYQAKDVLDPRTRQHVVAARRGERDPDVALVDAAIGYRRDGYLHEAEKYFRQAIDRNPKSWRAWRECGELHRERQEIGDALECYEHAVRCAPKRGLDRALIFRESGMLLRKSGEPNALTKAIERFEKARLETPHDPLLLHALADCHCRVGRYAVARPILEDLVNSNSADTRARTYPLLERCYEHARELLLLAELHDKKEKDRAAAAIETTAGKVRAYRPRRSSPRGRRRNVPVRRIASLTFDSGRV